MALIPPNFMDAVVTLESVQSDDEGNDVFVPVASAVLIGMEEGPGDAEGETKFGIWVVTARHVLQDQDHLFMKMNAESEALHFPMGVSGGDYWETFEDYDVAVSPLNVRKTKEDGAQLNFIPQGAIADAARMEEEGMSAGDGVFVIGFPMGIAGNERKYAVVRGGVIARFDDEIVRETNAFLIDSLVFPGNSGGLVLLRPEVTAVGDTKSVNRSLAIGIVSAYVPYIDVAISQQTRKPRITFEENSGLARIVPMDAVIGAIAKFQARPATTVDPAETPLEVSVESVEETGDEHEALAPAED